MVKPAKTSVSSWLLFLITTGLVFAKCWLFEAHCLTDFQLCDYSTSVRILSVLAASLCVGSVVWLSKRPWAAIVLMIPLDLWIIANMVYYKANRLLITYSAIAMSSNLHGFEASILSYLDGYVWLIAGLTLVYVIAVFAIAPGKRSLSGFLLSLAAALVCSASASAIRINHRGLADPNTTIPSLSEMDRHQLAETFNPFCTPGYLVPETWLIQLKDVNYTMQHSIAAYGIHVLTEERKAYNERQRNQQDITWTEEEYNALQQVMAQGTAPRDTALTCGGKLMIILVESWESWTMDMQDTHGNWILENIHQFMTTHPYLYASKVQDQIRHGVSADGQMMVNTGLLPLTDGAAAISYGENIYPNLAHFYPHSVLFDACDGAWNSDVVSKQWGYREHIAPHQPTVWMEDRLMEMASDYCSHYPDSSCIQIITYIMHSPFTAYKWFPDQEIYAQVDLPNEMDNQLKEYLRSAHWMDHYVGGTLLQMEKEGKLANTTIVLVGDHTYHRQSGYYTPLLIFSPQIGVSKIIEDEVYQMDTYPTILSLIGREDYFWQGFGANLNQADFSRATELKEAEMISDKLIRMNYFSR